MLYVKQIQKILDVDEDTARTVMGMMSVDFSECSQDAFDYSAYVCYKLLREKQID